MEQRNTTPDGGYAPTGLQEWAAYDHGTHETRKLAIETLDEFVKELEAITAAQGRATARFKHDREAQVAALLVLRKRLTDLEL